MRLMTSLDIATGVMVGCMGAMGFAWSMFQFHKHDLKAPFAAWSGLLLGFLALLYVGFVDQDPVSFMDPAGARASLTEER